jgi:alkyl hydroperoxide reductase subunit AhpC
MEIQGNSLYEVNKQLSSQEKILSQNQLKKKIDEIRLWFRDSINKYAMLLCHEQRDYTVFCVTESPAEAANALLECLENRGQVVSIDKDQTNNAWEIWLRCSEITNENQEDYCYYLFCYDTAVIEV